MRKDIVGTGTESTIPTFQLLESLVREQAQSLIQRVLEEEVTELLGREKSERIEGVDAAKGYRNGYGKPRKLTMSSGTITVQRPRVRDLEERFESRVLSPDKGSRQADSRVIRPSHSKGCLCPNSPPDTGRRRHRIRTRR